MNTPTAPDPSSSARLSAAVDATVLEQTSSAEPPVDPSPQLRSLQATLMFDPRVSSAVAPSSPRAPAQTTKLAVAGTVVMTADEARRSVAGTVAMTAGEARRSMPPPALPVRKEAMVRGAGVVMLPKARGNRLRALVFAILGVVALLLLSFGGLDLVASQNHRWLAPTLLSSTEPRVLHVAATLQQQTAHKRALLIKREELETRARETKEWTALEESFQASFKTALRKDLAAVRAEVKRLQSLLVAAEALKEGGSMQNEAADLEARLSVMRNRIRLLEAAHSEGRSTAYDVLALRRELDRSRASLAKTSEVSVSLVKALADVETSLAETDALLVSIETSPYGLAIAGDVALGFVPYENLAEAKPGAPVFACETALLFCRVVGTVGELLPGEVQGAHPSGGKSLRGQLVRLALTEPRSAERPLLYAGRAPL